MYKIAVSIDFLLKKNCDGPSPITAHRNSTIYIFFYLPVLERSTTEYSVHSILQPFILRLPLIVRPFNLAPKVCTVEPLF